MYVCECVCVSEWYVEGGREGGREGGKVVEHEWFITCYRDVSLRSKKMRIISLSCFLHKLCVLCVSVCVYVRTCVCMCVCMYLCL